MDETSISILVILLCSLTPAPSYQYQKEDNEVYSNNLHTATGERGKGQHVWDEVGRPHKKPHDLSCHICHSATNSSCFDISALSVPAGGLEMQEGDKGNSRQWVQDGGEDGFRGFPHKCEHENSVCMVRKFAFTQSNGTGHAAMKTFAIKRNCTDKKKCENGCVVMGERTRIYVCSTCCSTPLCNTGNGAARNSQRSWNISFFIFSIALKIYTF